MKHPVLLSSALALAACSESAPPPLPIDLTESVKALQARPEHDDANIKLQHILIAFAGAQRSTATRTKEEAEQLAKDVYARARRGEEFTKLMRIHTGDPGPGTYAMKKDERDAMVAGFGNVGWRLQVGEIGVAPFDEKDSPYGWHLIKRLE